MRPNTSFVSATDLSKACWLPARIIKRGLAPLLDYMDDFRAAAKQGDKAPSMKALPVEVVTGVLAAAMMSQRMLLSFDHEGRLSSTFVPADCSIISLSNDSFDSITDRIPLQRLPELAALINQRMAKCIGAMSQRRLS